MRRECRERFHRHSGLTIPTCIMARASRTCCGACLDRKLAVSFLWRLWRGNVPGIPGACTTRNFTYLVRGPWVGRSFSLIVTFYCDMTTYLAEWLSNVWYILNDIYTRSILTYFSSCYFFKSFYIHFFIVVWYHHIASQLIATNMGYNS